MSNNSTKQQELKHIASIVRALITSRKPPCNLKDILHEYNQVESKSLAYKALGYKTAQELLEDTGEFSFTSYGNGEPIITAKYSKNSAHISSMVKGQKSSKITRIVPVKAMKQPSRMPSRTNGFGDRNNNNNFSNNRSGTGSSNNSQQKQFNNTAQQQQQQQQSVSLQRQKSMGSSNSGSGNTTQAKDLREMLNSKKNIKTNLQQQKTTTAQQSPLASKVIQPQQLQSKTQQRSNDQQQKQPAGPRPILGASKQQQQTAKESQNSADNKKTEIKSQQQQQQAPTANKVEKSSLEAKVLKPQQRLSVIQNNLQQQHQQPQLQKQPHQQQQSNKPAPVVKADTNPTTQKPLPTAAPAAPFKTGDQTKPNAAAAGGIQNRLKVYVKPDYAPQPPITYNHQFSNAPKIDYNAFNHHQFSNTPQKMDAIAAVIQYCRSKNYAPPRFNVLKGKFSRGTFTCCVHINDSIISTYPHEFETEYLAKEACAKRALEKMKMQEKKRPLPSCSFSDTELLDKLYTELLNHPHGIFAKNLPETFETTFQQELPDNWWNLVQTSSLFTTETNLNKVIIFANKDADKDSIAALCSGETTKTIQIDPIRLPWSDEHWNIFVTHCNSTVEIWGRLFGKDYNVRFSALLNDISVFMATKKERPVSIARKNIYLVYINDSWHRVRVEELDKAKGSALCFFLDFGDADWIPVDQLYICETHFLRLPAQAVPFSLYGLEDFEGNPYARKCLEDLLPTKSVVGRIFTKENEFYDTNSKSHGKIQVVLYDTSSQEDVNLNHQLLNNICSETMLPEIKKNTVTNVIITHISDNGDIYLQVNSNELKYVQKLLQQIVESKFNSDQHKISFEDLMRSNLFLICDDEDANDIKWYRAALANTNIEKDSDSYEMYCVDIGRTKSTNISKIFLIESLSMALSKFPAQAIKVRLYNIPDITPNIVARIRGLLPNNCEALVRLSVPGVTPLVKIYTRLDGNRTLCTINEVICVEHELEGCSDLLQGCAIDDTSNATKSLQDSSKKLPHSTSGTSLASPTTPTSNPFIDVTRGLTLTKVPGSPQKSSDLPKLQNYGAIPSINDYFDVRITMSANPSNFTIQPYKHYPDLRALMKELQEFCENSDEFIPTDMVEIGEAYAAKNPDGFFHRVTVVKKYGDMIHVSFCDFGDIATVDSSQLKTLPLKFRQLPKMAVQAKLYGLKAVNGDWTLDDCLFFRKLTVGKTFVSVIKGIVNDEDFTPPTQILELELIDVTTDEDILIHELLLNENRAIKE